MSTTDRAQITGSTVIDCYGDRVGKASDVVFDDYTMEPTWVLVEYGGIMKHRTAVPYERLYVGESGDVVLESDKSSVKDAPRVHGVPLSLEESEELRQYYGAAV
jgi:sporulation protein YlmC with PRC-barrel domain